MWAARWSIRSWPDARWRRIVLVGERICPTSKRRFAQSIRMLQKDEGPRAHLSRIFCCPRVCRSLWHLFCFLTARWWFGPVAEKLQKGFSHCIFVVYEKQRTILDLLFVKVGGIVILEWHIKSTRVDVFKTRLAALSFGRHTCRKIILYEKSLGAS